MDGCLDIITDQKGILRVRVSVEGLSTHVSQPCKGGNAGEKFMEKWPEIRDLFKDHRNGEKWVITVNLGTVIAGESTNKIPEKAEAWLDIRKARRYPNREFLNDI